MHGLLLADFYYLVCIVQQVPQWVFIPFLLHTVAQPWLLHSCRVSGIKHRSNFGMFSSKKIHSTRHIMIGHYLSSNNQMCYNTKTNNFHQLNRTFGRTGTNGGDDVHLASDISSTTHEWLVPIQSGPLS